MVCIVFLLVERKGEREAERKKKLGQTGEKKRRQDTVLFTPKSQSLALLLGRDACPLRVGGSRGGASTWVHVLIEVSTQAGRTSSQIIVVLVNSLRWFCIAFNPPRVQYVKGSAALSMIFLFPRERDLFSFVLVGGSREELEYNVEGGCKCLQGFLLTIMKMPEKKLYLALLCGGGGGGGVPLFFSISLFHRVLFFQPLTAICLCGVSGGRW